MGEVFAGRYELLEPIAEGGMGSVWSVHDRKLDQVKAAKLLRQSDAGSVLRFVREQSMRIAHPHVVTPQTWAADDDRVLFTMPLVRGGSVAGLVGDMGPLPAAWVVVLLDQTLQALEAVHAAGIVHRDVKPANLLLEPTGTARPHLLLTDFGAAVPVDEPRMTRASLVFSTPGYTADEQLRGADPDPGQDLHSVGMVGLEMLSGVRPPGAVAAARTRAATEPGLAVLAGLLEDATSNDRRRRPADATTFRRLLAAVDTPPLSAADGVVVFTHLDVDGHAVDGTEASRRVTVRPPTTPDPTVRRSRGPAAGEGNRTVGVVLLVVAALCLLGALAVLLG